MGCSCQARTRVTLALKRDSRKHTCTGGVAGTSDRIVMAEGGRKKRIITEIESPQLLMSLRKTNAFNL